MIPISECGKRPPTFSRPSEILKRESQTRDYTGANLLQTAACSLTNYNSPMKLAPLLFLGFSLFSQAVIAQDASKPSAPSQPEPKSVTVPVTLDHNRVVIDVYLPLADGSTKRVRGWVDNGNPDLNLSQRVAKLMGLPLACDDKNAKPCSASPPRSEERRVGKED